MNKPFIEIFKAKKCLYISFALWDGSVLYFDYFYRVYFDLVLRDD